jgi:hypothetical protein
VAQADGAAPVPARDVFQESAYLAFLVRVFEQGQGCLVAGGPEVGDHDAGLGVPDAFVDVGEEGMGSPGQQHRICGGHRQRHAHRGVGGVFRVEV